MELWIRRTPDLEEKKLQQLIRCVVADLHDNGWRTREFQEALESLADWAAGEYPSSLHKDEVVASFKGYRCSLCQKRKAMNQSSLCGQCTVECTHG